MSLRESFIQEMQDVPEEYIRAELFVHNIFPSDIISKDILINMLAHVYYGEQA